jgi:hypothetical protein
VKSYEGLTWKVEHSRLCGSTQAPWEGEKRERVGRRKWRDEGRMEREGEAVFSDGEVKKEGECRGDRGGWSGDEVGKSYYHIY